MTRFALWVGLSFGTVLVANGWGAEPEVAELSFGTTITLPATFAEMRTPPWIMRVEQQGGGFFNNPNCWYVAASEPKGVGRLSIVLDRERLKEDLVATILFDATDSPDLVVQLFDAQGRVVDVDLFGNLVDVSKEATTDTFIIPMRKYPTADRIVIRRIDGSVKVFGVVLFPAVTEGEPNVEELKKLAAVLGDPLSPENPLVKGLQQIAAKSQVSLQQPPAVPLLPPSAKSGPAPDPPERGIYPAAVPPTPDARITDPPKEGLVGHWSFDDGAATDSSGRGHHGQMHGAPELVTGLRGKALRTRRNPSQARVTRWDSVTIPANPELAMKETRTVAAWINYAGIQPTWGSQIAWFGDQQFGRDPWSLQLYTDGTLVFRSDRSVTGKPRFTVFQDELKLSPKGEPMPNQHVAVTSPRTLSPNTWYFVAGTIEKVSPRVRAFKLFVNGELVGQVTSDEVVNYPTDKMWMTIGGVDEGTWQNFNGQIDDVRVYSRALPLAEIQALYRQPWD